MIDIATGSTTVRGLHTHWLTTAEPGAVLVAGGGWNEVAEVVNDGEMKLVTGYVGQTLFRAPYGLVRFFRRIVVLEESRALEGRVTRAFQLNEGYMRDQLDVFINPW